VALSKLQRLSRLNLSTISGTFLSRREDVSQSGHLQLERLVHMAPSAAPTLMPGFGTSQVMVFQPFTAGQIFYPPHGGNEFHLDSDEPSTSLDMYHQSVTYDPQTTSDHLGK
jgi:hypothetical protein